MKISEEDFLVRYFFRCENTYKIHGYFSCVNRLTELFRNDKFKKSLSGFYYNISDGLNSVRLSIFSPSDHETDRIITKYMSDNSDILIFKKIEPKKVFFSKNYGGTEIRFRTFLHNYAQISLDLLDYDLLYSRNLVAKYRFEYSIIRKSSRSLFEPAFEKHSEYYNSLSQEEKDQVLLDLNFWHRGADWAHMMVNALLPGDLNPALIKHRVNFRKLLDQIYLEYDDAWVP